MDNQDQATQDLDVYSMVCGVLDTNKVPNLSSIYHIPPEKCAHQSVTESVFRYIWSDWYEFCKIHGYVFFREYTGLGLYAPIPHCAQNSSEAPKEGHADFDRHLIEGAVTSYDKNIVVQFFHYLASLRSTTQSRIRHAATFINANLKLEYYNRVKLAGYNPFLSKFVNVGTLPEVQQIRHSYNKPSKNEDTQRKAKSLEGDKTNREEKRKMPTDDVVDCFLRRRTIDWFDLAETPFGSDSLVKHLTENELNDLLGWAISYKSSPIDGIPNHGNSNHHSGSNLIFSNLVDDASGPPLQPSILEKIHQHAVQILERYSTTPASATSLLPWRQYCQSALVAVGVVVEEMITASLYGLAQRHVKRCRMLQSQEGTAPTKSCSNDVERSFDAWTLPPEEAITGMLYSMSTERGASVRRPPESPVLSWGLGLPASRPATRITKAVALSSKQQSISNHGAHATEIWMKAHKIERETFAANKDLFDVLMLGPS
jgi:hypothetical protein